MNRAQDAFEAAASVRRTSLDELAEILARWLAARLEVGEVALHELRHPSGAGTSSETILASARWRADGREHARDLVFRFHPDKFQLFLDPDFTLQYRVIDVLHREGLVRVPEPLFFESDASVVGLPFYAMSQLHGRVPVTSPPYNSAGFLHDATPAERHQAWTTAFEEVCRIAAVPVELLPFLDQTALGDSGIEQQLEYWRRAMVWCCGGDPPDAIARLAGWLDANLPADRANGFAWGDARIGNMVFGDDLRLVGVLDWEQANNGGIRQDLGWWLFFDWFNSEGTGLRRLDGLGTRDETLGMWESVVGVPAGDTTWYEVFAGYKISILTVRTLTLLGAPDPRAANANPVLAYTCERAGIPVGA